MCIQAALESKVERIQQESALQGEVVVSLQATADNLTATFCDLEIELASAAQVQLNAGRVDIDGMVRGEEYTSGGSQRKAMLQALSDSVSAFMGSSSTWHSLQEEHRAVLAMAQMVEQKQLAVARHESDCQDCIAILSSKIDKQVTTCTYPLS